jgi:uncharacterized membrane protein YqjE
MESQYSISAILSAIKADIKELTATKVELLRLEIFEKTSTVGAFLLYGVILMNLLLFAFLFAFVAVGFSIGQWLNNLAVGFLIVTFFYLIVAAVLFFYRKSILSGMQNLFLKGLDPDLDNEIEYEKKHAHKAAPVSRKENSDYEQSFNDECIAKENSYESTC